MTKNDIVEAVNSREGDMKEVFDSFDLLIETLLRLGVTEETIMLMFRDMFWGISSNDTM